VTRAAASGVVALGRLAAEREPGRVGRDWEPVLAELPLFRGLPRRHLRRIPARMQRFADGTAIVRAGAPGNAFYVLLEGKARVEPPGGRTVTLKPGDSFGELALLDGAPRSADVTAVGEVLALAVSRNGFSKLLRDEPQVALTLLRTLAGRLRDAERGY
jgi:CRP-like cAMP-binding protein